MAVVVVVVVVMVVVAAAAMKIGVEEVEREMVAVKAGEMVHATADAMEERADATAESGIPAVRHSILTADTQEMIGGTTAAPRTEVTAVEVEVEEA